MEKLVEENGHLKRELIQEFAHQFGECYYTINLPNIVSFYLRNSPIILKGKSSIP